MSPTVTRRLALGITYGVNPLILPPLLFGLIVHRMGAPVPEVEIVLLVTSIFFMAVPLAYVGYLVRTARVETLEVRNRVDRTRPYLVGIASYIAGLALLAGFGTTAVPLVVSLAACLVLNAAITLVINLRWKISVHASAVAGFASVLLFVELATSSPGTGFIRPAIGWALVLLVPVMWSRVQLGAHSTGQVIAGALLGLILPYAELSLLSYFHVI